jgi:hypothetical protein
MRGCCPLPSPGSGSSRCSSASQGGQRCQSSGNLWPDGVARSTWPGKDIHDQRCPTSGAAAWHRHGKVTGITGLAAAVLIFAVLADTRREWSFTATADEYLIHYRSPNTVASDFRSSSSPLGRLPSSGSSSPSPLCSDALRVRRRGGRQSRWDPACSSWALACPGTGSLCTLWRCLRRFRRRRTPGSIL